LPARKEHAVWAAKLSSRISSIRGVVHGSIAFECGPFSGRLKMQDLKMGDQKDEMPENAGPENEGPNIRTRVEHSQQLIVPSLNVASK